MVAVTDGNGLFAHDCNGQMRQQETSFTKKVKKFLKYFCYEEQETYQYNQTFIELRQK